MRILPLLLLQIFTITASAQMFKSEKDSLNALKDTIPLANLPLDSTGNIAYRIIERVPGVNKSQLYARAKVWTAIFFKSAQAVTQLDDKENGTLILKGLSHEYYTMRNLLKEQVVYYLHFTVRIDVKDNKYRAIISDFQNEILADPKNYISHSTYPLESIYKDMLDWNKNAKNGAMEFNRQNDALGGRAAVRSRFEYLNNLGATASITIADIKRTLSQTAKADDF